MGRILSFLSRSEPYHTLPTRELEMFANHCRLAHFGSRRFLFFEDEHAATAYFLIKGRTSALKSSSDGRELVIAQFLRGDPFALLPVILKTRYPVSMRAETDVEVLVMPGEMLAELHQVHPELQQHCIAIASSRMEQALNLACSLAHDSVEIRLAKCLLRQCAAHHSSDITLLRRELAELSGSTVETISRAIRKMERSGCVDLSLPRHVRVLDRDVLRKIAMGGS